MPNTVLKSGNINILTDPLGNQTGHLIGIMSRIAKFIENKTPTIWVFDGQPP